MSKINITDYILRGQFVEATNVVAVITIEAKRNNLFVPTNCVCEDTLRAAEAKLHVESEYIPMTFQEEIGLITKINIFEKIVHIHSLDYNNLGYKQKRQYLEIVDVRLVSYQLFGNSSGGFSPLKETLLDNIESVSSSVLSVLQFDQFFNSLIKCF